jgi:hypothetical protein
MLLRRVFVEAVVLLDLALELVALPGNFVDLVIGKLTPMLLDFTFQLLPVSFDDIPIHCKLLSLLHCKRAARYGCSPFFEPPPGRHFAAGDSLLASYRKLNRAKFEVLMQLEKDLPVPLFTRERDSLQRDKRRSLSYIETAIPVCFFLLYAVMLGAAILARNMP